MPFTDTDDKQVITVSREEEQQMQFLADFSWNFLYHKLQGASRDKY